ncbi:MAG: diaminobutyrate acetyltransferase [Aquihabitans sp.]
MQPSEAKTERYPDQTKTVRSGRATPGDGAAMWELADQSTLDSNSPYAYIMWGDYFGLTSRVAHDETGLIGFVMGFRPPEKPDTLFVWQVGVSPRARKTGLASRLIEEIWAANEGLRFLESTVTPNNAASERLFRSFAERHKAAVETTVHYGEELFPVGDHEAEIRFRIGPTDP